MSSASRPRPENVVVIGGGIAGLAAGCTLARRGVDVTIVEANPSPGGCCGTTVVDGYTFHDGAVYVALPGLLDYAFARLGLDRAAAVPLRRIPSMFSVALPDGARVTIREGLDVHVEGASANHARVRDDLQRMMRKWEPVLEMATGRLITKPFSAWRMLRYGWKHLPKLRGTMGTELARLISDDHVRAALAGSQLHTGLPANRLPAASILGLVGVLREGLFLPERGMGAIPQALARAFTQSGGALRPCCTVRRIMVEDGHAVGVETTAGDRIDAGVVVSTVSPMTTFTSLVESANVPSSMARRVAKARLSHRAVSIQFGVPTAVDAPALTTMTLPMIESQDQVLAQDPRTIRWPICSVPTMIAPELAPRGGTVVEMFVPVAAEGSLDGWTDEDKHAIAESAIRAIGGFTSRDVVATRIRTPRDFRDGLHLYQGALYGISPAVPPQEQFPQTSPVRSLLLAGQCTYPGYGVAPAIMSGIFAADAAIDRRG